MKKQIAIVAGLAALMSTSAFATKSRMTALGQDNERGSHYISDTRNVFRNAAHVNGMKNYALTEWGTAAAETAEGGFFREMGAFTYGVYMGSEIGSSEDEANGTVSSLSSGASSVSFTSATGNSQFINRSNELHLFFGGDMGLEWGAHLNYSNNTAKSATAGLAEQKASSLGLGLGVVFGDLNVGLNLGLSEEYEGGTAANSDADKWDGDTGINVNVGYNHGSWTAFAEYDKTGADFKAEGTSAATGTGTYENTSLEVGFGHTKEVSSSARIYTNVSYQSEKKTLKIGNSSEGELKKSALPVTIGFEADANSWLTLRGSISQIVLINDLERKDAGATTKSELSGQNTTDVAAGATLNFGKLKVDGTIGTTGGTRGTGTATTEEGILALDNLMTQVAVHYWF